MGIAAVVSIAAKWLIDTAKCDIIKWIIKSKFKLDLVLTVQLTCAGILLKYAWQCYIKSVRLLWIASFIESFKLRYIQGN